MIEEKGYVFDSEALVGEAVVKGRFIGKLVAEGTLEINSSANIKGSFTAGRLVIPAGHHFQWPDPLPVEAADISGELVATLKASGTVWLRATARFFGAVQARNLRGRIGRRLRRHGANRRPTLAGDKRKCSVLSHRNRTKPL